MCSFLAVMEQAQVALTSPRTTTQSGFSFFSTFSNSIMVRPTCSACVPDPMPRFTSGFGIPSSLKNCADILTS